MKKHIDSLKVGILTFHRCINYGSYWQTHCLVEELRKRGHNAVVLNHQSRRVNFAEWRCALQPVLPTPVPRSDYPLYRQKIQKFFKAFDQLPLSPPFSLENPSQMDEYDMVIVGSDEVWNLSHPWYGYYPLFYGEGIRARRIISYAASFGNYDPSWKPDPEWVNKLHKFESISVRDENSKTIIKNTLGFEPDTVLDPCLQFQHNIENPEAIKEDGPYAAVYGHNFSDSFIRNIRQWAANSKLPLVSIGYRNNWADEQKLTAGPHEFASFMNKAEAVITNFFHGCIFALVNSRPFVCETSPYRSHKVRDLMKKVGGEKHLMSERMPAVVYETTLSEPLDEIIHKNIINLRNASDYWLNRAFGHSIQRNQEVSMIGNDHL